MSEGKPPVNDVIVVIGAGSIGQAIARGQRGEARPVG